MIHDQADSSVWQTQLYEARDLGGHTQTQNVPPSQVQRQVLSQLGAKTDFWTGLELYSVVHGHLNNQPEKPASLIIFEAKFLYRGSKTAYRFRSARINVSFTDYDQISTPNATNPAINGQNLYQQTQPCKPQVTCYAPFRVPENIPGNSIDVEVDKRFTAELGLNAQDIASAKAGAEKGKKESYQVQYFSRGTASSVWNERLGRRDAVWWNLQENPDPTIRHKLGIESNALLAVLVERQSDAPFLGHFDLRAVAQTWMRHDKVWSDTTSGVAPPSSPIRFDPAYPPQGIVRAIDANHLERFREPYSMARLVKVLQPLEPLAEFLDDPPEPSTNELQ